MRVKYINAELIKTGEKATVIAKPMMKNVISLTRFRRIIYSTQGGIKYARIYGKMRMLYPIKSSFKVYLGKKIKAKYYTTY